MPLSTGKDQHPGELKLNRRKFLKNSALATATVVFPMVLPSSVIGADSPSNRINFGFIGVGGRGSGLLANFVARSIVQPIAICDVDKAHRDRHENLKCAMYGDYRQLLQHKDIDVVVIATPDHWHGEIAMAAARAGKDIYCEKPLTNYVSEGRDMANTLALYQRILQTGAQQRSATEFRVACELVRNGYLGDVKRVEIFLPENSRGNPVNWQPEKVPDGFDYNMWLGPAPWAPYTKARCHYNFRFIMDYAGGQMANWGAHHFDIVQWAMDADNSGPIEIEDTGGQFPEDGLFTTATRIDYRYKYENGTEVIVKTRETGDKPGSIHFIGSEATVVVDRGYFRSSLGSPQNIKFKSTDKLLYKSLDHGQDFIDSIITRSQPISNIEIGHRSASVCHLGNIAMRLGKKLKWDPRAERFDDAQANRLLTNPKRVGW
ncbi:MAG: Gfo/Idh/MocA family oxidoreductase [Phycisphaerae bacterium]|nr:Gfo/Idh/MocA family oxidoreductase [Phycisphaerae bacterium]